MCICKFHDAFQIKKIICNNLKIILLYSFNSFFLFCCVEFFLLKCLRSFIFIFSLAAADHVVTYTFTVHSQYTSVIVVSAEIQTSPNSKLQPKRRRRRRTTDDGPFKQPARPCYKQVKPTTK